MSLHSYTLLDEHHDDQPLTSAGRNIPEKPALDTKQPDKGDRELTVLRTPAMSAETVNQTSITTTPAMNCLGGLPVELLIVIFSFCIEEDPDIAVSVSLVCQRWRTIITGLPSLWSHLRLTDVRFNPGHLRSKADLWFSRSGTLPVDLDLDTHHRDSVLPLLSYALRGAAKWRRLTYMHSRMNFLATHDGEEARLESLLVTLSPKKALGSDLQLVPEADMNSSRTWSGELDAPAVKNFKINGERLREIYVLGVRCLPTPEQVAPFETVTSLMLMNKSTECDFPMHQAVPFLSTLPALQSLEVSNFNEMFLVNDPEYRPDCGDLGPVELPQLRRLIVKGICSSRCILSHLRAPRLQTLILLHINSSTVYEHPNPGEPGDSEDEAHDFSRSPWTDHATGMGLRKLFSRGAPELRELIMDYADLRTKDFFWLFARLERLEKFTIVASDMSDNVIRAMGVEVDDYDWRADANEKQCEGPGWRAPRPPILPNLSRLKFSRCQKMAGDAVVRMIRSRLRAAETGIVAKFEELATTECLLVGERHYQELQAVFPPNARLVYAPSFEDDG